MGWLVLLLRQRIILSAGAIMSPIILFRSGIGPKDQVQAAKAEKQIVDLPVEKNLQDHPLLRIGPIHINDAGMSWNLAVNLTFEDISNYTRNRKGPLTTAFSGANAFVMSARTSSSSSSELTDEQPSGDIDPTKKVKEWPNLQLVYHASGGSMGGVVNGSIFGVQPYSRGVLTINSTAVCMDDLPLVDYRFYDNPIDLEVMVEGVHLLKIFEETLVFKKLGARLQTEPYGPCKMYKFRSHEYWKCFAHQTTIPGLHATGTCRMGHGASDPDAVVDSQLRVIGVTRLRVADASIFPYVPNANIYAPVMVVAEKVTADIVKTYGH